MTKKKTPSVISKIIKQQNNKFGQVMKGEKMEYL